MGIPLDLIDHQKYELPDDLIEDKLDLVDEELLKDDIVSSKYSKRSIQHSKSVPWLRRTEYIVSGFQSKSKNDGSFARKSKMLSSGFKLPNKDEQIKFIENSFLKEPIARHHTKTNVEPKRIMEVIPDSNNWGHSFSLVLFDQHPMNETFNSKSSEMQNGSKPSKDRMNYALMKGMIDSSSNDQFVAYFLPNSQTLDTLKAKRHESILCNYKLQKEYNWNFKNKTSKGFEPYFFLSERNGTMCMNEIETVIKLGRRKPLIEEQQKSTLVVQYVKKTEAEIEANDRRKEILQPTSKEYNILSSPDHDQELDKAEVSLGEEIQDKDIFGTDDEDL